MCKLKMHIDEGLENWPVLSMLLQPLVENSISHGFFDKENQNNYLLVKAFYDKGEDRLVIRIADNGEGMEPHEIDTLYQSFNRPDGENSDSESNIGLHNIFSRMKIAFGERFKMIIKSKKGLYTVIELHVPKNIDPIISKFSANKDV
jgi:two-component system sensor histidine kinase YesM